MDLLLKHNITIPADQNASVKLTSWLLKCSGQVLRISHISPNNLAINLFLDESHERN